MRPQPVGVRSQRLQGSHPRSQEKRKAPPAGPLSSAKPPPMLASEPAES